MARPTAHPTAAPARRPGLIAFLAVLSTAAALMIAAPALVGGADEPLTADLDDHLVAITTDFTGSEVLLFGSAEDEGEVVVVVHGPKESVTVRRKDRVAGIWMNVESLTFQRVPAFYHVASTASQLPNLPQTALERHQIGVENIRLIPTETRARDSLRAYREALIRIKQRQGNYTLATGRVDRRGGRLFRTTVFFPANVPVGTYTVETLLVRDREVVSGQTTPLFISKVGLGARIFRMAHDQPFLFGVVAVVLAVVSGAGASYAFRRG